MGLLTSWRGSYQGVSPFSLTYGQDAVLPKEMDVPSLRVSMQNGLTLQEYNEAMMMELESINDRKIEAFNYMLIQKNKVAQSYKRIKRKSFEVREFVWKIILSVGSKKKRIGQISQLGGTFQGTSSTTWKRILVSKPTRRATQKVHQW